MNAENAQRGLEYHPCRYGASKVLFRGPARKVRGEYVAYLGGNETFGRFVETPYPALGEAATGLKSINLGCLRAGIDAYMTSPGLIDICSMARVTVIQVMGAANMSNRFYTVDPRNNERFLRASKRFKEIYPEIDFSEFELTGHLLTGLARAGSDRLPLVRQELQCAWVARMRTLMAQIHSRKVLLWMSDHAPFCAQGGGTICREPLFVDRAMINAVADQADAVVEIVATPAEIEAGRKRLVYSEIEEGAAQDMLGPVVHARVAEQLAAILPQLASGEAPAATPTPPGDIGFGLAEAVA